ncbi:hypothetical protein PENTCL1PPCAC_12857, partial [Pristionchus entomophagus]
NIQVVFDGGLHIDSEGNSTAVAPNASYRRTVSSNSGTITGLPGNTTGGLTTAIFFNFFGPTFGIQIFKGFDYAMKVAPSSGRAIACSNSTCFGNIWGMNIPMETADGPPDGKYNVTFCT